MCMSVSVDTSAAATTLKGGKLYKKCAQMPHGSRRFQRLLRSALKGNRQRRLLTLALENGLSAAIVNPKSTDILKAYKTFFAAQGI